MSFSAWNRPKARRTPDGFWNRRPPVPDSLTTGEPEALGGSPVLVRAGDGSFGGCARVFGSAVGELRSCWSRP